MKQLWIGLGILTALLAVSLGVGALLEDMHQPSAADLEKAAASALEGDWTLASALTIRAKKQWNHHRSLSAALISHGSMDQIDAGFSQLELYAARENPLLYGITCLKLSQLLESIPQAHGFRWWMLL